MNTLPAVKIRLSKLLSITYNPLFLIYTSSKSFKKLNPCYYTFSPHLIRLVNLLVMKLNCTDEL